MAGACDMNPVPPDDETPSVQRETEHAKLYLRKFCPEAGDSLYNHLSEVLHKILAERPRNAFASFVEYSKKLRENKFHTENDRLLDLYVPPSQYKDAVKFIELFTVILSQDEIDPAPEDENEVVYKKPSAQNLYKNMFYFEQVDVGLPRSKLVLLNMSIQKFTATTIIQDVRFWGKILGRPKNYYIIEATLTEAEIERRLEELERRSQDNKESECAYSEEEGNEQENTEKEALESAMATHLACHSDEANKTESIADDRLKLDFPEIPINMWLPEPEVAPEKLGTGTNAKVYYVCNSPGLDEWLELPSVTPQQIVVARQMVHLFTGNLECPIHTYPLFPGNEKNYLRAQIARIGAATHVSPIGYFTFGGSEQEGRMSEEDEEEEEEEDDEEEEETEATTDAGAGFAKNQYYEQPPLNNLTDPSMSAWCHHSPYILKQGRVEWLAPGTVENEVNNEDLSRGQEQDEGEEDEDESKEQESEEAESAQVDKEGKDKGFEKEIGPPLLTPLSEDVTSEFLRPWTVRLSSAIQTEATVVLIRSNVWPGAFAWAAEKEFGNLYIGWGQKHHVYNYSPSVMPAIEEQYVPIDLEIMEIQDPSFEEEEAYRIAHLPPPVDDDEEEEDETDEDDSENDDEE